MPNIALGAKRYDGGSGAALFTGTVPLPPGMLQETQLNTVSLWDTVAGTEIGVAVNLLAPGSPRHPDGSCRVIKIDANLTVNSGVLLQLTLKVGVPPLASPPTPRTVDIPWMKAPTLIGCTSATYLCAARIAPWPLVPWNHPNLPSQWQTFLSSDFDTTDPDFPAYGNMRPQIIAGQDSSFGDTATYDAAACVYQRYLVSGNLDTLADAHLLVVYQGANPTGSAGGGGTGTGSSGYSRNVNENAWNTGDVQYYSAYGGHAIGDPFPLNYPPYPTILAPGQKLGQTEWNSGFHHDMWFAYVLSGWPQALGTLLPWGIQNLLGSYPWPAGGHSFGAPTANYDSDQYGGRFTWRLARQPGVYVPMLGLPMDVQYHIYEALYLPNPKTAPGLEAYQQYLKAKNYDIVDAWSLRWTPSDPTYGWMYGTWFFAPTFSTGANIVNNNPAGTYTGGYPSFDAFLIWAVTQMTHLNVIPDSRVPTQLANYATLLKGMCRPSGVTAYRSGRTNLWCMPYMMANPAVVARSGTTYFNADNFYPPTVNLVNFTHAYAVTGDPSFLTIADAHATRESFVYGSNLAGAGRSWKNLGQMYLMAFAAAAYRAGVPASVWDVPLAPTTYASSGVALAAL